MTAWVQWILDSNSIFKHFCIYKKIKFRIKCLHDPSTINLITLQSVIVVTMDILFCWNPNFYVDHPTAISGHQFCKMCFILGLIAKCHTKAQNELQSRRQLWRWCPVTAGTIRLQLRPSPPSPPPPPSPSPVRGSGLLIYLAARCHLSLTKSFNENSW